VEEKVYDECGEERGAWKRTDSGQSVDKKTSRHAGGPGTVQKLRSLGYRRPGKKDKGQKVEGREKRVGDKATRILHRGKRLSADVQDKHDDRARRRFSGRW